MPHTIKDRGWSWFVLFGSFMIYVIMAGLLNSFGIFYVAFLDYFNSSKSETSWIGSILTASLQISGPITGLLINRFGCRYVAISGAIVASVGFISTTFVPNIYWLYLTFGIIPGIGYSFLYSTAIVGVGQYFEEKRSLAFGISSCGAGVGNVIFSPLTMFLIDMYSFRGALLIETGLLMNCAVAGSLFRPFFNKTEHNKYDRQNKQVKISCAESEARKTLISDLSEKCTEQLVKLKIEETIPSKKLMNDRFNHQKLVDENVNCCHQSVSKTDDYTRCSKADNVTVNNECECKELLNNTSQQANVLSFDMKSNIANSVCSEVTSNNAKNTCLNSCVNIICRISASLGFHFCKEIYFVLYVCSNCFIELGTLIGYIYLPDRAKESGIGNIEASLLLSIAGVFNMISKILIGWLADKTWTNSSYTFSTLMVFSGVCTLVSPMINSYYLLIGYAALFGITVGAYKCLSAVILVEFMGEDTLASSFGLVQLFKGICVLFGIPLAGWLYDETSSYSVSFYMSGALHIMSGISMMLGFIAFIAKKSSLRARDVINSETLNLK